MLLRMGLKHNQTDHTIPNEKWYSIIMIIIKKIVLNSITKAFKKWRRCSMQETHKHLPIGVIMSLEIILSDEHRNINGWSRVFIRRMQCVIRWIYMSMELIYFVTLWFHVGCISCAQHELLVAFTFHIRFTCQTKL